MLIALSHRLLSLLQLTRMALVFTAIADSQCALLLATNGRPSVVQVLAMLAASIGLYGFGMSLNDIIDRRRDRQIASHRPLPSGRVGILAAYAICGLLALLAILGGIFFSAASGNRLAPELVVVTLLCIGFYDLAGKYLVGPGLLTLGLVRFFHALIPAAGLHGDGLAVISVPAVWHPLLLLTHVAVLSALAYRWEEKRPSLTRRHWWGVLGSLVAIDALVIWFVGRHGPGTFEQNLNLRWQLILPLVAALAFAFVAWRVRRTTPASREAGQKAMLLGLLWLIVYDACFVAAYVGWLPALLLALLLPLAYFSVQLMRWWSQIVAVSQRPEFKRAGGGVRGQ